MLRRSMVRALQKDERLEVMSAGNVSTARALIFAHRPRVVISDLSLPDGTGLEVVQAMDEIGLFVPVILVTAYMVRFKAMIPRRSQIEVHEKPLPIEKLRRRVEAALDQPQSTPDLTPFTVADYIQLAELGRRSVVINVTEADGREGEIIVIKGQAWWARDSRGDGEAAFRRLVLAGGLGEDSPLAQCRPLANEAAPRNIHQPMQELLLDSVRELDERTRDLGPFSSISEDLVVTGSDGPEPAVSDVEFEIEEALESSTESFEDLYDRGIEALLDKRYPEARRAFEAAARLQPTNASVQANLERLSALGYGDAP